MTEQQVSRTARLAEVDGLVAAAARAAPDHPHRGALHGVLDDVRRRLGRAHTTCEQVGDAAWAEYVTRLDHGLDELTAELSRVDEPTVDQTLYVHATRLELDGWVLRLDHARAERPSAARELADRVGEDLTEYRRGGRSRVEVDAALERLREMATG